MSNAIGIALARGVAGFIATVSGCLLIADAVASEDLYPVFPLGLVFAASIAGYMKTERLQRERRQRPT